MPVADVGFRKKPKQERLLSKNMIVIGESKCLIVQQVDAGYSENHANHSLSGNNIFYLLSLLVYVVTTRREGIAVA